MPTEVEYVRRYGNERLVRLAAGGDLVAAEVLAERGNTVVKGKAVKERVVVFLQADGSRKAEPVTVEDGVVTVRSGVKPDASPFQ